MDTPNERTPLHRQVEPDNNRTSSGSTSYPHDRPQAILSLRLKIAATTFSFIVLGLFTSSIGALLGSFEHHYNLSDGQASLVFLFVVGGYILGAQLNEVIHSQLGQRGVALIGPVAHLIFVSGAAFHPPYVVLLILLAVGAFGTGALDGSWSSWAGGLEKASTVSGLLHGAFSSGAAAGPFLVGLLLSTEHGKWYQWYYVLTAASFIELLALGYAFRAEHAERYQPTTPQQAGGASVVGALKHRTVWACAVYLLVYVGFEAAISGWVVLFMLRNRHASVFLAGLSSSAFWGGMSIGRLVLGALADRFGLRRSVIIYHAVAMVSVLVFIAVQNPVGSVVMMVVLGIACGPLFPSAIVYLVSKLPPQLHVVAVSTVCSMGQVGGALLPTLIGLVADGVGLQAFQGIIFIQLIIVTVCWIVFTAERPNHVELSPTEE